MSTTTITEVSQTLTLTLASTAPTSASKVRPQGGIFEHSNPSSWNSNDPITLFIIQAGIIIIFCRLLHYPLSKLRQPRVIAEVIGGVILGPSVMGHIPGFTAAIFPTASMPSLSLVANLGLVLFLFLVGLEVDLRFLISNWRIALSVGAAGMALPFGLGASIAWGLYNQFKSEPGTEAVSFGVFMLFIGVAMAITAFPVLCRILTELKLLQTPVGIIVLSAGVGNDVVGWVLLALCVALVNAGTGLTALYVLLVAVGYTLFLAFAIRPVFMWILRKTGSTQNGPTQSVVALTLLLVLTSAFFTDIIGIHAIFGAFMVGLICPHEGGFAIKLTEKVEDLVCTLLLPLYFALSGLSTNLGLLNDGITWAYVVGIIAVAFCGKVIGGTLAARFTGLLWRESLAIGALMSCKGLVELIVLNIGLQAKILSTRTFTMFVVMALITTFATTPLVSWLYPHSYQAKLNAWKRGEIDWEGHRITHDGSSFRDSLIESKERTEVSRLLAHLRLDSMSGVLALVSLLARPSSSNTTKIHPSKNMENGTQENELKTTRPFQVYGVRLSELSERSSSVMKVTEIEEYSRRDPVLNTLRTFGQISNVAVSGAVLLCPEDSYASTLVRRAVDVSADLMLLPWSESGGMSENGTFLSEKAHDRFANSSFSHFLGSALSQQTSNIAFFVDNGFGSKRKKAARSLTRTVSAMSAQDTQGETTVPVIDQGHHIFMPFFGSEDDKVALRMVLQLAKDPSVTATIVYFELVEATWQAGSTSESVLAKTYSSMASPLGKSTKSFTTAATPIPAPSNYAILFNSIRDSLPRSLLSRVVFESVESSHPAYDMLAKAKHEIGQTPNNAGDLIVMGRNAGMASISSGEEKDAAWTESDAGSILGMGAGSLVKAKLNASLLVLKAIA